MLGAAKVCTNTNRGLKKQGGSIGAYGLLVHMVFARFKRKQQPRGAERPVGGCCFLLNLAKTIFTNNPDAPVLPPCFLKPFLVLVHTLVALVSNSL